MGGRERFLGRGGGKRLADDHDKGLEGIERGGE